MSERELRAELEHCQAALARIEAKIDQLVDPERCSSIPSLDKRISKLEMALKAGLIIVAGGGSITGITALFGG